MNIPYNLDANTLNADWTKTSWDLPYHTVQELEAWLGTPERISHFKTLPVYKFNVNKPGMEWLKELGNDDTAVKFVSLDGTLLKRSGDKPIRWITLPSGAKIPIELHRGSVSVRQLRSTGAVDNTNGAYLSWRDSVPPSWEEIRRNLDAYGPSETLPLKSTNWVLPTGERIRGGGVGVHIPTALTALGVLSTVNESLSRRQEESLTLAYKLAGGSNDVIRTCEKAGMIRSGGGMAFECYLPVVSKKLLTTLIDESFATFGGTVPLDLWGAKQSEDLHIRVTQEDWAEVNGDLDRLIATYKREVRAGIQKVGEVQFICLPLS
jgi:hypothetical protein